MKKLKKRDVGRPTLAQKKAREEEERLLKEEAQPPVENSNQNNKVVVEKKPKVYDSDIDLVNQLAEKTLPVERLKMNDEAMFTHDEVDDDFDDDDDKHLNGEGQPDDGELDLEAEALEEEQENIKENLGEGEEIPPHYYERGSKLLVNTIQSLLRMGWKFAYSRKFLKNGEAQIFKNVRSEFTTLTPEQIQEKIASNPELAASLANYREFVDLCKDADFQKDEKEQLTEILTDMAKERGKAMTPGEALLIFGAQYLIPRIEPLMGNHISDADEIINKNKSQIYNNG